MYDLHAQSHMIKSCICRKRAQYHVHMYTKVYTCRWRAIIHTFVHTNDTMYKVHVVCICGCG